MVCGLFGFSLMPDAFGDSSDELLSVAKKRNPEYKPFDSPWLNILSRAGLLIDALHSRSFMYAIKAGIITCLAALPGFLE